MPSEADLAKLETAYQTYVNTEQWQAAVQNRLSAAGVAFSVGRRDLFRSISGAAITLARDHHLRWLELNGRIFRFKIQLTSDLSGSTIDELKAQIDFVARLKGNLLDDVELYCHEAIASYQTLLADLQETGDGLTDRSALSASIGRAAEQAAGLSQRQIEGKFEDLASDVRGDREIVALAPDLRATVADAVEKTKALQRSLHIDLLLLVASFKRRLDDPEFAKKALAYAESVAVNDPPLLMKVHGELASLREAFGNLDGAIASARNAIEAAEAQPAEQLRAQSYEKLAALLGQELPNDRATLGARGKVALQLNLAHLALREGRSAEAFNTCQRALSFATTSQDQYMLHMAQAFALYDLDRKQDAEVDVDTAIALIKSELSQEDPTSSADWPDRRFTTLENLGLMKAWLLAEQDKAVEAWDTAERFRAQRLKLQLAAAQRDVVPTLEEVPFDRLGPWLVRQRVAILAFGILRWGTLVLSAGPDDVTPHYQLLRGFRHSDLGALLPNLDPHGESISDDPVFAGVEKLSESLLAPISDRLQTLTRSVHVLYLIPDSLLYVAPFAALEFAPNRPLAELVPLAIVPAASLVPWSNSRRRASENRSCLAGAVGDSGGFKFSRHLPQIATAFRSPRQWRELKDDDLTRGTLAAEAPHYDVLYLSCHGYVEEGIQDGMQASQLELAGKLRLPAREVMSWHLHASLVFLNACQSGRFRAVSRTEVNGFPRAFLVAGARSLIAPMIKVNPEHAGDLAHVFFVNWLNGCNAAQALQTAQLTLRRRGLPPEAWAAHLLFGGYAS
ncbi:CHAT domain-containing protein [Bradyrhizobium sp.]